MTLSAAIAMNRFGLGARIGQIFPDRPQRWLLDQLAIYDAKPVVIRSQPSRADIAHIYQKFRTVSDSLLKTRKNNLLDEDDIIVMDEQLKAIRQSLTANYAEAVNARLSTAVVSNADFTERLVHFWSNHFAISADNLKVTALAGCFEFEAIRPNILGSFKELLESAIAHPAMLIYLEQVQSIGPNSAVAQRYNSQKRKKLGLNENLAREIFELHTIGARNGYNQVDVNEFARALTGLTVAGFATAPIGRLSAGRPAGDSFFLDAIHEPGIRQIMGKKYDGNGKKQIRSIIADLASHPSTARHIATKLAQHFVAGIPSPSLVTSLERSFLESGGKLPKLYQTLVEAPESWPSRWEVDNSKFKSPWEWVISSLRALGNENILDIGKPASVFAHMGQPIWKPGSPAGYGDKDATWTGSSALLRRLELASLLSRRNGDNPDPRLLAPQLLHSRISANTIESIASAESPDQGLSLLLMSPEFLRR